MKGSLWSNPWFLIPVLLFLNVALVLLLFVPHGHEVLYFNTCRIEPFNSFFRFCTELGEPLAFVLMGLVSMLWRYRYAVLLAIGGLVLPPVSFVLKDKIGKDRPITYFEKLEMREAVVLVPGVEINGGQTSFPSGHTLAAFTQFGVVALLAGARRSKLSLICALAAILVGISRIFLAQHFLVDVLAGAVFGLILASLFGYVDHRFLKKWPGLDNGLLHLRKKRVDF